MVYEELKKATRGSLGARLGGTGEISSAEISVMGAASKLVASVITYPSQVRRTDVFLALSASWALCPHLALQCPSITDGYRECASDSCKLSACSTRIAWLITLMLCWHFRLA